jgi:HD-GYP domain-containing protein (c-di-GMP phosphodiesterase class II)
METYRLSTSHVKLGEPLPGDVYDESGKMLLSKGYVLASQTQIDSLLSRGMYVDIATFEACFRPPGAGGSAPAATVSKFDPFLVRSTFKIRLHRLLRCSLDGSAKLPDIHALADDIARLCDADCDAAIAATFLDRDEPSYATGHSLGTATLCALAVQRLGWDEARRRSVVCAALTMNLGMLDLQQRLQRQATELTAAQREQLHAHPEAACAALEKLGVDDVAWLAAVRQHHERPGGKGYPAALETPTEEANLIRLADAIGARVFPRADRRPLPAGQVVRALYVEEGQTATAALVGTLVKLLGLHPPGCFVRLANNESGVVFRRGPAPNALVVAAVTSGAGSPLMQPVRRETQRPEYAISGALTADKMTIGYDLAKLWVSDARH